MDCKPSLFQLLQDFAAAIDKNDSFEVLFHRFEPLLDRYARELHDNDAKYFLAETLFNTLSKIPLTLEHFKEDKFIISYIRASIKNEFFKICKQNSQTEKYYSIDDDVYVKTLPSNDDNFSGFWCACTLRDIKTLLSDQEFEIFNLIYIGFNETEIADVYSVTRQAICKRVKVIRGKIIANSIF